MKKIIIVFLFCIMQILIADEYISIGHSKVRIGNDELKYKKDYFWDEAEMIKFMDKWIYPVKEHEVELSEYKIGRNKITNREYEKFLRAVRKKTIKSYRGEEKGEDPNKPVEVTVYEALAYCQWMSDRTGKEYRLPTSAEWEYAFTGGKKQKYPWGNEQKILESLGRKDIVEGNSVGIDEVKEDKGWSGIENAGGGEIILDGRDIDPIDQEFGKINTLYFSSEGSLFSQRGMGDYNDLEDERGLYMTKNAFFDTYELTFRMVEGRGQKFNREEKDECIFYQNSGKLINLESIYEEVEINTELKKRKYEAKSKECYILFKKEEENEKWYFIVYDSIDEWGEQIWEMGWVNEKNIEITNKKWYESLWDNYIEKSHP